MGIPYDEDTFCDISEEEIIATALSNEKYLLFLGSKNGVLTTLDYESKEVLVSTPYHDGAINCLRISHCGNMLVSGSSDRSIKVMSIDNNQELFHFEKAHEETIMAVEISHNSRFVISGCGEGSIRVFELVHNKEVHTFNSVHNAAVSAIRAYHHSNFFASSSYDGSIKIFDLSDMVEIYLFRHVHNDRINTIAISADDKILFSASSDLSVKIFDLETKQLIRALSNIHESIFFPLELISRADHVSCDFDEPRILRHRIRRWNLEGFRP
jgi:WD40 repeat protein